MPIVIPPFVQYQAPLFPLRGLWNAKPAEGDRFVSAEIDWTVTTGSLSCVQFALSGNSPVAFSQIVAFSVDNSRCSVAVDFLFPDSGFVLTVPGYNQGVYPVFTNALMFYATATGAALGDQTIFQVLNSMPPPVAIQPDTEQQTASVAGISITTNHTTAVIAAPTNGTLSGGSIILNGNSTTVGNATLELVDGDSDLLWGAVVQLPVGSVTIPLPLGFDRLRFFNGVNLVVTGSGGLTTAGVTVNLYYSTP